MRISGVPHPYRKACPSVAQGVPIRRASVAQRVPLRRASVAQSVPLRRASVAHPCRSVAVALRSCRTQGQRLEPKDHCIQSMPPSPRGSHYAATLRAMPRRFAIAAGVHLGPQLLDLRRVAGRARSCWSGSGRASPRRRPPGRSPRQDGQHELAVGLRASSRSPPMDSTTRPMPRFDRSASRWPAARRRPPSGHAPAPSARRPRLTMASAGKSSPR